MSQLTLPDHRHLLQVEIAALTQAASGDDRLALEIPHIEGWTVQSLIGHLGWVMRYVRLAVEADVASPPSRSSVPEPPTSDELMGWFSEAANELTTALDEVDPAKMCVTFAGPQKAEWWIRRIAHEVAMHRWDVESAAMSPNPIDAAQAKDGVDEVLEVFVPQRMQFATLNGQGETIHLHATDIDDGEWMITLEPEQITWTRGHEKGDVAARGPVSDLLLMLWSRIPAARLQVFGDASLVDRWQEAATF